MTSPSMPWIKLYTARLNDPRLGKLDDAQKWRYIALYLLAGRLDAGGYFIENGRELTNAEIAFYLRSDPKTLAADFRSFKAADLAIKNGQGWQLTDFESEQGPSQAEKREQWKERQARHRDGKSNAIVTSDTALVTRDKVTKPSRVTNAPRPKNQKPEPDQESDKDKDQHPTPNPSRVSRKKAGSGGNDKSISLSDPPKLDDLKTKQLQATARKIRKILGASGLREPKLESTSVIVAIRSKPTEAVNYTLAALASAYADSSAKVKPAVAAYRIENDQVDSEYFEQQKWRVIPKPVLEAAGITDLEAHIKQTSLERWGV